MAKKRLVQCPRCGKNFVEKMEGEEFEYAEIISKILKSNKTPHEKKMKLFK